MAITITTTWRSSKENPDSIYSKLAAKLGRQPTNAELKADWNRILEEGMVKRAGKGQLRHQRRR
jgi:hypothetical protein